MTGTRLTVQQERQENYKSLRVALEASAPKLMEVLPKGVTPERMVRMTLVAVSKNIDLLKCSRDSVLTAVLQVASWGLEIGRTAHLVPFGTECTAIPDYKGLVQMAVHSESARKIDARVVREDDVFELEYGLAEKLIHRPVLGSAAPVVAVYAIALLPNGAQKFEVMAFEEVEAIRKASKGANATPWKNHWSEMAKKTVTKRLLKTVPLTEAAHTLADALDADNEADGVITATATPSAGANAMNEAVAASRKTTPVEGTEVVAEESKPDAEQPDRRIQRKTDYTRGLVARQRAGDRLTPDEQEEVRQFREDHPDVGID